MLNSNEITQLLRIASQYCAQQDYKGFHSLLEKNPQLSINENLNGKTWSLLHIASYFDFSLGVKLLIEKGANVNIIEKNGSTPLLIAVSNNCLTSVDTLIKYKAQINKPDNLGYTPLMSASSNGNCDILELLIENKGDINLTDKKGQNAFDYAGKKNNGKVTSILEKVKMDSFLELTKLTKKTISVHKV